MGPIEKRIKELTETIENNPNNFRAYIDRGWAWQEKGDIEKARHDMEKARQILLKKNKNIPN